MRQVRQGFTLIELLIVIAILGLLTAIIIAGISKGRGKAIVSVAQQNFSGLVRNVVAYHTDHGFSYAGMCDEGSVVKENLDAITGFYTVPEQYCLALPSGDIFFLYVRIYTDDGTAKYLCLDPNHLVGTNRIQELPSGACL